MRALVYMSHYVMPTGASVAELGTFGEKFDELAAELT